MIAIGSDHGGFALKQVLINYLDKNNIQYKDFGVYNGETIDYPLIAKKIANAVTKNEFTKGILVCGSGLGVAISANKIKGIRAVTCHDTYSAKMSRAHNNANILTMGGRVIGPDLAIDILEVWLNTEFEGGRHVHRINMIE